MVSVHVSISVVGVDTVHVSVTVSVVDTVPHIDNSNSETYTTHSLNF